MQHKTDQMRAEDPIDKIHACSTNSSAKKQTVHPAVLNSDTLIDASVTVYQIHIDQDSPNFLGEEHISQSTTVRGPVILRNVIFSGYVTFYQINIFFVNTFSLLARCVLRPSETASQVEFGRGP